MLQEDSIKLFNNIFKNFMARYTYITALTYLSSNISHIKHKIYYEQLESLNDFLNDKNLFIDKKHYDLNLLAQKITQNTFLDYSNAINSANLLFIHTILDNSVNDFLKIIMIKSPEKWIKKLNKSDIKMEISFKKLNQSSIIELKNELFIKKYMQLTKKSLTNKITLVVEMCNSESDRSKSIKIFKYDKNLIEKLDKIRHQIVHGQEKLPIIENFNEKIDYLKNTFVYLFTKISKAYNLKIIVPNYSCKSIY